MATISPIDLQKALKGAEYPTGRKDLVQLAQDHGADTALVERIESLPDKEFDGPDAVSRAVFESA
ncbi:DUF2795 domain-containing protein [Streptomyces sp. 2A115]|uniref:DUF2795 domain-containing protein n=1 Tax=Streptomyces sp. 2A115 TaxID=3457439 RepID=UPI003FCF63C6